MTAKRKIRFNLPVDGTKVRTLEELRDHFHLDDVLALFRDGTLLRWLDAFGFAEQSRAVQDLPNELDDVDLALRLAQIFEVELNEMDIRALTYSAQERKKWTTEMHPAAPSSLSEAAVIQSYHEDYEQVLQEIERRNNDDAFVQTQVRLILGKKYWRLIAANPKAFVSRMRKNAPLALLAALMHEENLRGLILSGKTALFSDNRRIILPCEVDRETIKLWIDEANKTGKIWDISVNKHIIHGLQSNLGFSIKNGFSSKIVIVLSHHNVSYSHQLGAKIPREFPKEIFHGSGGDLLIGISMSSSSIGYICCIAIDKDRLPQPIEVEEVEKTLVPLELQKTFYGHTQNQYKILVPRDKKVMVLHLTPGSSATSAGNHEKEITANDANGRYPILDGLAYKSNNPRHAIHWVEILPLGEE